MEFFLTSLHFFECLKRQHHHYSQHLLSLRDERLFRQRPGRKRFLRLLHHLLLYFHRSREGEDIAFLFLLLLLLLLLLLEEQRR